MTSSLGQSPKLYNSVKAADIDFSCTRAHELVITALLSGVTPGSKILPSKSHLLQEEGCASPPSQWQEKQHKEFCTGGSDGPGQDGHLSLPFTFHRAESSHGAESNCRMNWGIQFSIVPRRKRKWVWWIASQLLPQANLRINRRCNQ